MKKNFRLILASLLILGLCGCSQLELPPEVETTVTVSTGTTESTALPEATVPQTELPDSTEATEASIPTDPTDATESTDPPQREEAKDTHSEQKEETKSTESEKPEENTGKQQEETKPTVPPATESTQPATDPTDPPSTKPTEPPETQPPETEPPATEAPTQPTEPPGCQHDWKCIHHEEVGHWRAGIVCDCGWTVYGDPNELVALWNAHSASYPGAESLFDHGGYGSADEWIVDEPAYDEWVCRHCGEPKP